MVIYLKLLEELLSPSLPVQIPNQSLALRAFSSKIGLHYPHLSYCSVFLHREFHTSEAMARVPPEYFLLTLLKATMSLEFPYPLIPPSIHPRQITANSYFSPKAKCDSYKFHLAYFFMTCSSFELAASSWEAIRKYKSIRQRKIECVTSNLTLIYVYNFLIGSLLIPTGGKIQWNAKPSAEYKSALPSP